LFSSCIVKFFSIFVQKKPGFTKRPGSGCATLLKYKVKPPEDERRDNIVLEHLHGLLAADEQQLKHAGLTSKLAEAHQGLTFNKTRGTECLI
jgi:hypothetical protein